MKIVIITGTTGKLGEAYLNYFRRQKNTQCVAFSRKKPEKIHKEVVYLSSDLLDRKKVEKEINKINFKGYSKILFIHPIGMFKFEYNKSPKKDKNRDGIDDDIFASNVLTFTNVFDPLKEKIKKESIKGKKLSLTICAFGSISDKYNVPFWGSYTKSKNFLRRIIKASLARTKSLRIEGVFVNVSTTHTANERSLRPKGNKTYWLTPKEIVSSSINIIDTTNKKNNKFTEMNIYKYNPKFDPTWYTNHENVLERWEREMGIKLQGGKK